ncbi:hypothetical protein GQX73_g684 [Xylaria multiplex]|uniref:Peptidase M12A domain-containing protein n=1 Tax=Xylaria multiplex TaxID=323545 RepID=A0A7C8IUN6_9PEZI|nr:hypothetical protein GQX73_g684 [Xylaria multiplex]
MAPYEICTLVPSLQEPDVPEDILHLGVVESKMWDTGHTLKIYFMGGSKRVCQKVKKYAQEWTKHANIEMEFMTHVEGSEIRVAFENKGSWSVVGKDCLNRNENEATMNLAWLTDTTPDNKLARTVYHEFGHALGCVHEHQNPVGGIQWDKEKVYHFYANNMGWDTNKVDTDVLVPCDRDMTQFSLFDKDSIMLYHFPKELTVNGYFVQANKVLSSTDKEFIGKMYPKASLITPVLPTRGRRKNDPGLSTTSLVLLRRSQRIANQKALAASTKGTDA